MGRENLEIERKRMNFFMIDKKVYVVDEKALRKLNKALLVITILLSVATYYFVG